MEEYKKYFKVTFVDRDTGEETPYNRVDRQSLGNMINSFRNYISENENSYLIVEPLTKEEFEETEQ